jgi:hypothetical protein
MSLLYTPSVDGAGGGQMENERVGQVAEQERQRREATEEELVRARARIAPPPVPVLTGQVSSHPAY